MGSQESDLSQTSGHFVWAESAMRDLKLAVRSLRKSLGFAATAILTLALGIGANTAIFQLLDAVRLRSLPVADPAQLVAIQIKGGNHGMGVNADSSGTQLTYPMWEELQAHHEPFSGVFVWATGPFEIGSGAEERPANGLWISGPMFSVLGVKPYRGRFFTDQEQQTGCGAPGLVISYALWQREFGGQDSAIGSNLVVYGRPAPVIGVTPPRFFGLEVGKQFDIAIPFCSGATTSTGASALVRRDYFWLRAIGRLKPGWTSEQASAQLESTSPGLFEATTPTGYSSKWIQDFRAFRLAAYPASNGVSSLRTEYDTSLWLLLSITGLVLLIACANLANLMLVRATAREREMAVRLALGASRWRLIWQLLSEGMVLAVSGAIGGLALARVFSKGLVRLLATAGEPLNLDLSMDWRMLAFTGAVAIVTCLAFALLPAFRCSRTPPADSLKSGSRGTTQGRERFSSQRTLVALQISVSLVLLVGALLFVRSFWNLMTIDPGLREKDIVVGLVDLRGLSLAPEKDEPYVRQLLEKVRAIPQVQSAATATLIPLTGGSWSSGIRVDGAEGQSKFTWVSPGYFDTLQIPLLAGRDFNERDTRTSMHVAIVNQTFVRKFLEGVNPIGRVIRTNSEPDFPETEYEIVGLIKDTKYGDLREETPPMSFAPASQYPPIAPWTNLIVRASSSAESAIPAVRQILRESDPGIRTNFRVFQTEIESGLIRERTMALLSGFFGALAALLAVVGLYGVISYVIAMRKNEIGIRLALGASRSNVIGIIVSQTMQVLAVGVVLGVALSLSVTRGASSLIFGLRPNDPLSIVAASAFLIVVALIASYLPAFRASRISPMKALRYE